MTRHVDGMERSWYVCRTPDATDRRRVLVEPTETRPDQLDYILAKVTGPVVAELQALTPEQRQGVATYVRGAQHAYAEVTAKIYP